MRIAQLLNWKLNDINVQQMLDMGFTHIQIGPMQPTKTDENQWYWLYQPTDFTIGNRLGSWDDFVTLCKKAHLIGLQVSVDVVMDHPAGRDDGSLYPHEKVNPYLVSKREFLMDPIQGTNPDNDRWQCTHRCYGMPRYNYFCDGIVEVYENFLLNVLAFADTIRIDMGKHFATPSEGGWKFWQLIKSLNRDTYAEMINTPEWLKREYAEYTKCLVLDYEADIDKDDMVVAFETHDTFLSFGYTKDMSDEERINRYRNIVREYPHTMFYFRPYDSIDTERIKFINIFSN